MKDLLFYQNLNFNRYVLHRYHYRDNRSGVGHHYLAYMERGTCRLVFDGRTVAVQQGELFYIPKGLRYQSYWESEDEIRFLSYGFLHFPESRDRPFLLQTIDCPEELKERVRAIPVCTGTDSALLGSFYGVLAELLPYMERGREDPRQALAATAQDYLYEHSDCKVSDVARHCLVSEAVLYDVIKRETGMTPNTLRQRILCKKAEQMLITTDRSVQDISDRLGFSSTSYFRKILFQNTGKTPSKIRKTLNSDYHNTSL